MSLSYVAKASLVIIANENGNIKNIMVSRFRSVISSLVERPILIIDSIPAI